MMCNIIDFPFIKISGSKNAVLKAEKMVLLLKAFGAVPRDTVCFLAPIFGGRQQP